MVKTSGCHLPFCKCDDSTWNLEDARVSRYNNEKVKLFVLFHPFVPSVISHLVKLLPVLFYTPKKVIVL